MEQLREIDEERKELNAIIDVKTNGYINLCKENREMGAQMDRLLNKNKELMRITDISSQQYDELLKQYQQAELKLK